MTAMQPVKRKTKREVHAYFEVRRMIDPATGEEVGCLVPRSQSDRRMLRDKAIKTGDVVRLPVRKPRNEKYNRLAHALGALVVEQIRDGLRQRNLWCPSCVSLDAGVVSEQHWNVDWSLEFRIRHELHRTLSKREHHLCQI